MLVSVCVKMVGCEHFCKGTYSIKYEYISMNENLLAMCMNESFRESACKYLCAIHLYALDVYMYTLVIESVERKWEHGRYVRKLKRNCSLYGFCSDLLEAESHDRHRQK